MQYYILLPDTDFVGSVLDVVRWSALLKSASALAMYRRQYGKIIPKSVAEFLILDRQFPRAMHFCLMKAQESLRYITGSTAGTFRNLAEQRMGQLCSSLDYTSIRDIINHGLHEYIDNFQNQLNLVGNAISENLFKSQQSKQSQISLPIGQWQTS